MKPHPAAARRAAHPAFVAGCRDFDHGRFWHAHEAWEGAWHEDPSPDRGIYKGLIQIAAVQYHLARGRPEPARALLARGAILRHLGSADPRRWPLDLALCCAVVAAQEAAFHAGRVPPVTRLRLLPMLREYR